MAIIHGSDRVILSRKSEVMDRVESEIEYTGIVNDWRKQGKRETAKQK